MISLEHVSKKYGSLAAVSDFTLTVPEGETLILLGPSGCGKTTTLKMINRLIEPDSGAIKIAGKDVMSLRPEILRRNTGYVIQNTGLFPHYTIEENIAVVAKLLKWNSIKIHESVREILKKVRLSENYLKKYPHQLSGGQQQRVGLARALITDPPVVLMDEPLGALDPVTRNHIRKEFASLEAIRNKTVVMVTHDIEEAFELGDKICLMDKGCIQQMGTAKELLFNPKNDFVEQFFYKQRYSLQMKAIELRSLNLNPYLIDPTGFNQIDLSFKESTSIDVVFNELIGKEKAQIIGIINEDGNAEESPSIYIKVLHQELYNSYLKTIGQYTHG